MNKQDYGILGASIFLILALLLENLKGDILSVPGITGAIVLSMVMGISFYAKGVRHGGTESFSYKKLATTVILAAVLGGLAGQGITEQQLAVSIGGGLGTSIAVIVETLGKAITKEE